MVGNPTVVLGGQGLGRVYLPAGLETLAGKPMARQVSPGGGGVQRNHQKTCRTSY